MQLLRQRGALNSQGNKAYFKKKVKHIFPSVSSVTLAGIQVIPPDLDPGVRRDDVSSVHARRWHSVQHAYLLLCPLISVRAGG